MRTTAADPPRPRVLDLSAPGADSLALIDDLLDRLADRVADRVLARLGAQAEQDAWLDLTSAADRLGIHPDTLRKRAKAGLVPFEQDGPGCRMYFRSSDLDAWRHAGGATAWRRNAVDRTPRRAGKVT